MSDHQPHEGESRSSVFLGGPIQHALCAGDEFDPQLRRSLEAIYETLAREYEVYSAHFAERFGDLTSDLPPQQVAERDFRWMQSCDAFLAVLPDGSEGRPYRTDGTFVEIGWASAMRKPILLLPARSPMTSHHSHLIRGLDAIAEVHIYSVSRALEDPDGLLKQLRKIMTTVLGTAPREMARTPAAAFHPNPEEC